MRPTRKSIYEQLTPERCVEIDELLESMPNATLRVLRSWPLQKKRHLYLSEQWFGLSDTARVLWTPDASADALKMTTAFAEWPYGFDRHAPVMNMTPWVGFTYVGTAAAWRPLLETLEGATVDVTTADEPIRRMRVTEGALTPEAGHTYTAQKPHRHPKSAIERGRNQFRRGGRG